MYAKQVSPGYLHPNFLDEQLAVNTGLPEMGQHKTSGNDQCPGESHAKSHSNAPALHICLMRHGTAAALEVSKMVRETGKF